MPASKARAAGPRIEFLAAGVSHFETQAVAQVERSARPGSLEAFQGDAAGVVRQVGNVLAHMLANTGHERGSIGGTGAGRGAGQNEKSALRGVH